MKYRFLGAVSTIYYIMAGIVLIAGCGFGALTMTATRTGFGAGIGIIIASVLAALSLAAFGQLIALLVDLAHNTAETAKYLAFMASRRKASDQSANNAPDAADEEIAMTKKHTLLKNRVRPSQVYASDD